MGEVHLWEFGILLIGITFAVTGVYMCKILKSLLVSLDNVNKVVVGNVDKLISIIINMESLLRGIAVAQDNIGKYISDIKNRYDLQKIDSKDSSNGSYDLIEYAKKAAKLYGTAKMMSLIAKRVLKGEPKRSKL